MMLKKIDKQNIHKSVSDLKKDLESLITEHDFYTFDDELPTDQDIFLSMASNEIEQSHLVGFLHEDKDASMCVHLVQSRDTHLQIIFFNLSIDT